jgi:hypothetical protein
MVAPAANADELSTRLLARLDALLAGAEPTPPERSWLKQLARDLHAPASRQRRRSKPTSRRRRPGQPFA